jgi:TPR repeat protein
MTTKELVAAASAGDKDAMRKLEQQVAKKAKANKTKMDATAGGGDPLAVFQKTLMSGDGSDERLGALADAGNPNALLWQALDRRYDDNLTLADKEKYGSDMIKIAGSGDQYKNHNIAGGAHPLSAEAAFQISEDKLSAKWLFGDDSAGAIEYLKQAAQGGHSGAMLKLSSRYEFGLGMDKDSDEARAWLEKAASAGNHDAKRALKSLEKQP